MKMFSIREDDLADLERIVPQLADAVTMDAEALAKSKRHARVCKRILSDVRWDYGPPDEVEVIPAD